MKKNDLILAGSVGIIIALFIAAGFFLPATDIYNAVSERMAIASLRPNANVPAAAVPTLYTAAFQTSGMLTEASSDEQSISPYWWLDSGAYVYFQNGTAKTIQGALPDNDPRKKEYSLSNPTDTDGGSYPQNIFRLISRNKWRNVKQEAYFKITRDNLSESLNRNESNGILLFNRYVDSDNLYYAGLRVDGAATIKKKINGKYFEFVHEPVIEGKYDKKTNPNILPKDTWIGLRTEISTTPERKVSIKLFSDIGKTGDWKLVAEALDDGVDSEGIIDSEASIGIRTDFMDVEFDGYLAEKLL